MEIAQKGGGTMKAIDLSPRETMVLQLGPHYPSQPGPYLLKVTLDHETIVDADIEFGFNHRGFEKLAENRTYLQFLPLTDRICYVAALSHNDVYCRAVEELMKIEVPERAKYIRTLALELQRIASHTICFSEGYTLEQGFLSMMIYILREREKIMSLMEELCGSRLNMTYFRFGGVRLDLPKGFKERAIPILDEVDRNIAEYDRILETDSVFLARNENVGVLKTEDAIKLGVTGPVLRGSNVNFDLRKADPYDAYDKVDFEVCYEKGCDNLARFRVRVREIHESIKIIKQCLKDMPQGPIQAKLPKVIRPPPGEVYARIEDPRGEMGMYLVSDGGLNPYRLAIRGPAFRNSQALPPLLLGYKYADIVAIAGSTDGCTSEVDR